MQLSNNLNIFDIIGKYCIQSLEILDKLVNFLFSMLPFEAFSCPSCSIYKNGKIHASLGLYLCFNGLSSTIRT